MRAEKTTATVADADARAGASVFTGAAAASLTLVVAAARAEVEFHEPVVLESPNAQAEGYFGAEGICAVPDVNADGVPDFAVAALGEFGGSGRVYVFDGRTFTVLHELSTPTGRSGVEFGSKLGGIGDVNGNGSGEVLAVAHGNENTVHVIDGATGEPIHNRVRLRARSVSAVPDADGDGLPEILASGEGSARIYDGSTGAGHVRLDAPSGSSNLFGWACGGLPDVTGDGLGDAAVGDWMRHAVHVYDGATGELVRTLRDPEGGRTGFGRSVKGLSDVDGDGLGEILVGSGDSGRAHLLSGADGSLVRTFTDPVGEDGLGWVVSPLPDVTGDGGTDVVLRGWIPDSESNAYVFDPVTGEHLATLPGNRDFGGGDSIVGVPDLNGDGLGEVIVGNWQARSSSGRPNAGHVLVFLSAGAPPPLEVLPALEVARTAGSVSVSWAPGSGFDRLQISVDGEAWEDVPGVDPNIITTHAEPVGPRGRTALFRLVRD